MQDYYEAVRLFRIGAEQGIPIGQANLGEMYHDGKGVQQDYVQAYMWLTLSVNQGFEQAKELLETLKTKMTPDQIAGAKRLVKEWKAKEK